MGVYTHDHPSFLKKTVIPAKAEEPRIVTIFTALDPCIREDDDPEICKLNGYATVLVPKRAVPTRTRVLPSSMARDISADIPIDSVSTLG